jgi:hypothetical protein
MELRIREVDFKAGAKSKGANGVVAVGLPHRNYAVLKRTPYQSMESKRKIGVGRNGLFVSPSLRTGLADLPHPALQLMVLPQRGLTSHFMGG